MRFRFWALQREDVQRDLDACVDELPVSFVLVALTARIKRQGQQREPYAGSSSDL